MPGVVGYKVALFLTRAGTIAASDFASAWLAAGPPVPGEGLLSHVHNAPAATEVRIENAPPAPFDGIDEYLFASAENAAAYFASGSFRNSWLEPRKPLLGAPIAALAGDATAVWNQDRAAADDAVKILTLPVRREGMDKAAFVHHWLVVHAGLALDGPGTRERLLRLISTPADVRNVADFARAPFDGIGVIQFDSAASLSAEFASPYYRTVMAPDEPRFTDPEASRAMMVREIPVLPD
jgi:uncharacterized protein (TIGR02118 family)